MELPPNGQLSSEQPQAQEPLPGSQPSPPPPVQPPAAQPPPPSSRRRATWVIVLVVVGALVVLGGVATIIGAVMVAVSAGEGRGAAFVGDRVAVIRITGIITTGEGGGGLLGAGAAGSEEIIRQLHKGRDDSSIKAIVLRINSPGGSPAASQEIYREIMRIRESKKAKKPIMVSMADVAASGAYYVAAAADKIVANPATLTGSIGVIQEGFTFHEVLKKIGIQPVTIKTGPYKDTGSGFRPWREDEIRLMQAAVNDVYWQFIDDVAKGRKGKLDRAKVKALADGRIFTGAQAKKKGLVDELGNLDDAINLAAKQAGIKGKPNVINLGRRSPFGFMMSEAAAAAGRGFAEALVREGALGSLERVLQQPALRLR